MTAAEPLSAFELDALREVANIGSGHAATVLSKLTGRSIMIDVPNVRLMSLADVTGALAAPGDPVVVLAMRMLGDLTGDTFFVLHERNAALLCDLLLGRAPGTGGAQDETERSSLREAGNILAGGFLNALSTYLQMCLMPSVPAVRFGRVGSPELVERGPSGAQPVLVATTNFRFTEPAYADHVLNGVFLFSLDAPARRALFDVLRQFVAAA
jgi:chemotaxis protein CheC